MKTRTLIRPALAAVGITAAAIGAFALPAGAAVSVQSGSSSTAVVKLGNKATLDANGAVVFAPVKITCTAGSRAYLQVNVTEAVGKNIARGAYSTDLTCTGSVQSLRVAVTPTDHPFQPGVAFGQALLQLCDSYPCLSPVNQHNIQIVTK